MKRSEHDPNESLELLLDTICNMFGTIIFVALIAALLALTSTAGRTESSLASVELERERQLESLTMRAEELERELETLPAAGPVEEDAAAAERVAAALGEIKRREDLIARYESAIASVTGSLSEVRAQVAPLREEIDRLRAALESARRTKDRVMRTPLEHALERRIYTLVIWRDRIYPVCNWSNRSPDVCALLSQWDNRYTVAASCSLDGNCRGMGRMGFTRKIPLRPDAGIPIIDTESLRRNPAFREILTALDPSEDMVLLDVAPDSFDSFSIVKELVLEAGIGYTLSPCHEELPLYRDAWMPGIPQGL